MSYPPANPFPTTHWSLVALAGDDDGHVRRAALESLLRRYLGPLRSFLMARRRLNEHQADDVLQEFVCSKVLVHELMPRADRERGRFRTYLLTALERFTLNKLRDSAAYNRRANAADIENVPERAADDSAPIRSFEVDWARQLLQNAVEHMKRECEESGRRDLWEVFNARLLQPMLTDAEVESYDDLIKRVGIASPAAASNLLITAKRMFVRNLRALVAEYEPDEAAIDREIVELRSILAAHPGN
jgi:RNA polymerase sigma-70 factor (ECF subfamily)